MVIRRDGSIDCDGVTISFQFWRSGGFASGTLTIEIPDDVALGEAINKTMLQNIVDVDPGATSVFVKRGERTFIAHVHPRRLEQHAGLYVIDPENVELEPFA